MKLWSVCSECGESLVPHQVYTNMKFCPNCGATFTDNKRKELRKALRWRTILALLLIILVTVLLALYTFF
ncbi:MAG: hypothetical protein ACFE8G_13255 [Candidatus Hermodarchaeota archaeon]